LTAGLVGLVAGNWCTGLPGGLERAWRRCTLPGEGAGVMMVVAPRRTLYVGLGVHSAAAAERLSRVGVR